MTNEKKKIKYKTKIIISLESFNFAKMQKIAYGYYNTIIPKNINDPEKVDDYVWVNSSQSSTEEVEGERNENT